MAKKITVLDQDLKLLETEEGDYVFLPDMAKGFGEPKYLIQSWMRNRNTLDFLFYWEEAHNLNFNALEFDDLIKGVGGNTFKVSISEWIKRMSAIGLIIKGGRGGGSYAHPDIAGEFGMWLSPQFKIYLIKEFRRLKAEEAERIDSAWDFKRQLTKINYRIHTDAIRDNLIPPEIRKQKGLTGHLYATEADVLNKALFGMTAQEWRKDNTDKEGNIRDAASATQLIVLSNLESLNAEFIKLGLAQEERLERLNQTARSQLQSLIKKQKSIDKLSRGGGQKKLK